MYVLPDDEAYRFLNFKCDLTLIYRAYVWFLKHGSMVLILLWHRSETKLHRNHGNR